MVMDLTLMFIPAIIAMVFSLIPLAIAIWFILKIQSIDTTLKEISLKMDRVQHKDNIES
jgi:hypothetical protein